MRHQKNIKALMIFCLLFVLACSGVNISGLGETPTPTEVPASPTATRKPTSTRLPTATPNVVQTQNYDDILLDVRKFKDEGIIPSANGTYTVMDDFKEEFAQIGYLTYWYFDFELKNFVYKAHAKWSTAAETDDTSGCGIVFAIDEKENSASWYGVVLDKKRIFFSSTYGGYYYDMGKTRGTGKLNFGNPAEADFTLVVYDYKAFVYVDDDFIGEYTLSKDRALAGKFGYGIISGTNRDYGTRCEITNSRIWELAE